MKLNEKLIEGIFISESKNRFLCKVLIDSETYECYIPSSSKLGNYIKLRGKRVLLTENKGLNTRTKYSIFAVKHYSKYIILNLNIVNELFEQCLNESYINDFNESSCLFREKVISGYKADLYYEATRKTIIENKSIISVAKEAFFPTVYSQRAIDQLNKLYEMLHSGYKVVYNFISLGPFVENIIINYKQIEYYEAFLKCIDSKMEVNGYYYSYKISGEIEWGKINVNI